MYYNKIQWFKTINLTQKKQVLCDLRTLFLIFNCQTPVKRGLKIVKFFPAEQFGGVDTSLIKWMKTDGIGRICRNGINFTERAFGIRAIITFDSGRDDSAFYTLHAPFLPVIIYSFQTTSLLFFFYLILQFLQYLNTDNMISTMKGWWFYDCALLNFIYIKFCTFIQNYVNIMEELLKNKIYERFKELSPRYRINRKYKDKLFRLIFSDKKNLLELYNAVNSTNYTDTEDLEITTIDDAIYMGMKNDLSFLIANILNLYEHQSTLNPNMPFRGFLYFARLLESYVKTHHLDIYGAKQIQLPAPVFLVFYNGEEDAPEEMTLQLSDSFAPLSGQQQPALECTARMLNINYGHNKVLLERCKRLHDYSYFIDCVRSYIRASYHRKEAVSLAVDECIEKGILADILEKNRSEVVSMLLTTFDKKLHDKTLRREGFEDGFESGTRHHLMILVTKKLNSGQSIKKISDDLMESPEVIQNLVDEIQSKKS